MARPRIEQQALALEAVSSSVKSVSYQVELRGEATANKSVRPVQYLTWTPGFLVFLLLLFSFLTESPDTFLPENCNE